MIKNVQQKPRNKYVPISLDIGTLIWYRHDYSDAVALDLDPI